MTILNYRLIQTLIYKEKSVFPPRPNLFRNAFPNISNMFSAVSNAFLAFSRIIYEYKRRRVRAVMAENGIRRPEWSYTRQMYL